MLTSISCFVNRPVTTAFSTVTKGSGSVKILLVRPSRSKSFRIYRKTRPDFQSSVDETRPVTIDNSVNSWSRLFPHLCCWDVKGPLELIYHRDLGYRIFEELKQFVSVTSSAVSVNLFMVGRTPKRAKPRIVISSKDKASREAAKALIDRSKILDNSEFRLWLLKFPPSGPIKPMAIEDSYVPETLPLGSNIYLDPTKPYRSIAMPIYIKHSPQSIRRATANLVYNGKEYAYITAAHAFVKTSVNFQPAEIDDEDLEMPFDSDSENGSVDDEFSSQYSQTSPKASESEDFSPALSRPPRSRSRSRSQSFVESLSQTETPSNQSQPLSDLETPNHPEPTLVAYSPTQQFEILGTAEIRLSRDFAVISVNHTGVKKYLRHIAKNEEDRNLSMQVSEAIGTNVIAWTTHGAVSGRLAELPTFLCLPTSNSFELVYKFTHLDKIYDGIQMGDCGSLVTDEHHTKLYGHVIAKSENSQVVYMMAAKNVAVDMYALGNWEYVSLDDIDCKLFSYPVNGVVMQSELC
jgi:hypothetical protein